MTKFDTEKYDDDYAKGGEITMPKLENYGEETITFEGGKFLVTYDEMFSGRTVGSWTKNPTHKFYVIYKIDNKKTSIDQYLQPDHDGHSSGVLNRKVYGVLTGRSRVQVQRVLRGGLF